MSERILSVEIESQLQFMLAPPEHNFNWCSFDDVKLNQDDIVVTNDQELKSFSTLYNIIVAIQSHVGWSNQEFEERVGPQWRSFQQLLPQITPQNAAPTTRLTREGLAGSRLVRRIGRESIRFTDAIDGVARALISVEAFTKARVVFIRAEMIDRPTMRVLHRMASLCESPLNWVWAFGGRFEANEGSPCDTRFVEARRLLFDKFAEEFIPGPRYLPSRTLQIPELRGVDDTSSGLVGLGYELQQQNFDRAYLLANHLLNTAEGDERAQIYKLLVTIDANSGLTATAFDSAAEAIASAASVVVRAQCLYAKGLLETKRHYDVLAARKAYEEGLNALGEIREEPNVLLERAWLNNGLALADALEAKALPLSLQRSRLEHTFKQLGKNYIAVSTLNSAESLYLQLNLIANMVLTLETMDEHERALRLWQSTLSIYRGGNGSESISFEISFLYRAGILSFKSGLGDEALTKLRECAEMCQHTGDLFAQERVSYALASVAQALGRLGEAKIAWLTGIGLAVATRQPTAAAQQLAGLASLLESEGSVDQAAEAARWLTRIKKLINESQWDIIMEQRVPASKFPSYVRTMDLETELRPDLNRYLTTISSTDALLKQL